MNDKLKEIAKQARLPACHLSHPVALQRFAELVRQDERKRLDGVTAHEQMLIDGQQSLLKGKK